MKKLQLLLVAALAFINATAQKLPNKQETSVRIPANVKIDGKATEWNNKFQAYNKTTDFFYTIANNNDELYLIIQTSDPYVFNKIIDRGLTLSVKNPETGKTASFTFPTAIYNVRNASLSTTLMGHALTPSANGAEADMIANNKTLRDKHKFIKTDGVEGVDTLVSVYNEDGIHAAELFDGKKVYTLEMGVKRKLMGILSTNGLKIRYKLKVNGFDGPGLDFDRPIFEDERRPTPEQLQKLNADIAARYAKTFGGTDFEGEYTLAK
jgi:hypothetical protein